MNLELGWVVEAHPEDHSVDLVMLGDGSHLTGVQVLADMATIRAGRNDLGDPSLPASGNKWDLTQLRPDQQIAAVGYVSARRLPIVVGFLFPQVCQMLFARKNFRVERHASDVYSTVDDSGNIELFHPSGTHLRIAETADHEDLTGHDFDAKWKIDRNTTRAPWLSLILKNAGVEKARLRVDPSGNVTLTHAGNLTVTTAGTAGVTSSGDMTLTAPNIHLAGNVAASGGSLTHNGTNVGSSHVHGGVMPGGSSTTGPS